MLEQQLFTSLSGLSDEVFVQRAYLALLGRPADPSGFRHNLERLRSAVAREQVWEDLANSEESVQFRGKWLDAAPAAERGAAAKPAGAAPAAAATPGARPAPVLTAAAPARSFAAPPRPAAATSVKELLAKDGADLVQAAYWAILGREADSSGLKHYAQRLAAGDSKQQVLADLRRDPEGRAFNARIEGLDELVGRAAETGSAAAKSAPPVRHVNDLFALHGADFLRAAYVAILKRDADPDGLQRYGDVLRSGRSRSHVLKELAASAEARANPTGLAGLPELLAAYDKAQEGNWSGWYWRTVRGAESDLPPACELRLLAYAAMNR
jgi:pyruvate/2-oxoglutarate dehydrogenase complex dihydrolipoamide acyltransferase (E2) component